jgi:type IV pilus assembly protein PilZ
VELSCELADGQVIRGRARDISIGGMFIETEVSANFGTPVVVVLRLPNAKTDLRLPAVIRWLKPGGFGVQFGLLGARETHALSELIQS